MSASRPITSDSGRRSRSSLPRRILSAEVDAEDVEQPSRIPAAIVTAIADEYSRHASPQPDALIFDLRENHGGDPNMVDFMVSYLFQQPAHINDLTNRHDNEIHQYWTLPWVLGPRFADQPVYVLTSHETYSGGEEFTFDLKTQKRATIVGETTGGGAHPVQTLSAGDHFTIGVPFGRSINPVTKGDWEGKGVEPDVKVTAAEALTTAEKLAADKLAAQRRP